MADVSPNKYFSLLNPEEIANNWTTNKAGTVIPNQRSVEVRNTLANSINHLSAHSPRVLCSRFADAYSDALTNLVVASWKWPDYWYPSDEYEVRIIGYTDGTCTMTVGGSASYKATVSNSKGNAGRFQVSITVDDSVSSGEDSDYIDITQATGVTTYIYSITVQEKPKTTLSSESSHPGVYRIAKSDEPILSAHIEECRSALHSIFDTYYPTVYWFASSDETTLLSWTTEQNGPEGFIVTATSATNIFDLTSTSRTTSTNGFYVPAYGCGIGKGTTVRLHCRVKAGAYNFAAPDTGTITFTGPNGSTTISIVYADDGLLTWKGDSTNYITLNTTSDWNDATSAMNKVDVLANVDQASTGVRIAAISCWLELVP